jgi:aspartate kinase
MARQSGVADKMFRSLADAGINIQMISTSEIKISALVERDKAQESLRAVHQVFKLDTEPPLVDRPVVPTVEPAATDAAVVASQLQDVDMEKLTIEDISLDESQARVTIRGVPDTPGIAATVFEDVAAAGVLVDMIVQSHTGHEGQANLSFTVAQERVESALQVARRLAEKYEFKAVASSPRIAKLSVSGVGLRSHTGVAIRMFRALAEAGINVEMINTSEVHVNAVVDGGQGREALARLEDAFADVLQ